MTLPTYNEMQVGVGARIMGLLLVPFFVLLGIGLVLVVTQSSSPYYPLSYAPIFGGIAWLPASIYYLYKKLAK